MPDSKGKGAKGKAPAPDLINPINLKHNFGVLNFLWVQAGCRAVRGRVAPGRAGLISLQAVRSCCGAWHSDSL